MTVLKIANYALVWWLSWLECHLIHQKVVGSIPAWDTYWRQLINVSLSHQCFCLFPPQINKHILR